MSKVAQTLGALRDLGSVAEVRTLAAKDFTPTSRPKVNAHIHLPPNFSAFTTVAQTVELAAKESIAVLGVSNYYDYNVYGDFGVLARGRGVYPLFGMEIICMHDDLKTAGIKINDPANPGKMYLCGKGLSKLEPMTATATRLLGQFRDNDVSRIARMIDATEKVFTARGVSTGLNHDRVIDMVVRRHGCERSTVFLQERHVAQAFQEAIFAKVPAADRLEKMNILFGAKTSAKTPDDAVAVQNDLRSHLLKVGKPAYIDEAFVTFRDAYELIHAMGGFACYPLLADAASPINAFETPIEQFIAGLKQRNIHATEFIPNRNSIEILTAYTKTMRAAGLVVTAGTEHNTLDLIPLEPVCKGNLPIPEELKAIYWEGACVIAAHQFLTLHGQTGYVDADGRPNAEYPDADTRIKAFAKLGAAVIRRYQETAK